MVTLTTKFSSSSLCACFQSYVPHLIPIESNGTSKAIDISVFNSSCFSGVKSFSVIFNVRSNLVCSMGSYKSCGGETVAGGVEEVGGSGVVGSGAVVGVVGSGEGVDVVG